MKNTLCLFASISLLSLIACGDLPQKNPSQSSKDLMDASTSEVAPEREDQSVYPKPMVPVAPQSNNAFAWGNDQRFNFGLYVYQEADAPDLEAGDPDAE